jgi:hemerythrin
MFFSKSKPPKALPFFEWLDEEHSIGVPVFDREHQKIFQLINDLHARAQDKHERTVPPALLEGLRAEVLAHFAHEEQVMEKTGFPGREAHLADHRALVQELQEMFRQFQTGGISVLALPLFLKKWFIKHLIESDRKYAAHLRSHGLR